jgi:CheY-like chemotaxis protein
VTVTVLIAASEHLAALQEHTDLTGAEAFADTDAIKALDTITRQRPSVIALEKVFAASARGAALINRIKADPALASCEIRIVESNSNAAAARPAASTGGAAAVAVEPSAPAAPPVYNPERRAPRVSVTRVIEILVDGNPATLVNISVVGAQVVSLTSLRPNQHVRMSLVDPGRPIRFSGMVAWSAFEMPREGPRYRAGIDFFDAAPDAVARFIDSITG